LPVETTARMGKCSDMPNGGLFEMAMWYVCWGTFSSSEAG